jgi:hypothetical protein
VLKDCRLQGSKTPHNRPVCPAQPSPDETDHNVIQTQNEVFGMKKNGIE